MYNHSEACLPMEERKTRILKEEIFEIGHTLLSLYSDEAGIGKELVR